MKLRNERMKKNEEMKKWRSEEMKKWRSEGMKNNKGKVSSLSLFKSQLRDLCYNLDSISRYT